MGGCDGMGERKKQKEKEREARRTKKLSRWEMIVSASILKAGCGLLVCASSVPDRRAL
jgi:hypothetical protein